MDQTTAQRTDQRTNRRVQKRINLITNNIVQNKANVILTQKHSYSNFLKCFNFSFLKATSRTKIPILKTFHFLFPKRNSQFKKNLFLISNPVSRADAVTTIFLNIVFTVHKEVLRLDLAKHTFGNPFILFTPFKCSQSYIRN